MTLGAFASHKVYGAGPRRVLAFHCTLASASAWRGVGQALAKEATLIAPDLPSHGRAPDIRADQEITQLAMANAAHWVESPIHVVGHSFGAIIALRLALERPEAVASLTLIEPVMFFAVKESSPEVWRANKEEEDACSEALNAGDAEGATRLFNRRWGDGTAWSDFSVAAKKYMVERIPLVGSHMTSTQADELGLMHAGRLESLSCPVLVLRGTRSPDITALINDEITGRLKNGRQIEIQGARHLCVMSHPQDVASAISSNLQQT